MLASKANDIARVNIYLLLHWIYRACYGQCHEKPSEITQGEGDVTDSPRCCGANQSGQCLQVGIGQDGAARLDAQAAESGAQMQGGGAMSEEIRRHHPFEVRCSSCGAPIVWFRTKNGKRMPVDEASTQPADAEHQLDLKRHISHFATCPNANQHRRK